MASALKELDEVTECSICTEVFTDPRVLPCVHTYCLKCIKSWGKDKNPGDKLACPLCRKECAIPEDGLERLPRNFFVEKVVRIRELSSVATQPTPCDMCTYRAESGTTNINSATAYCVQCQENYCEPCSSVHRKHKLLRDHKLLQIGERVRAEDLFAQYPPSNCDKHVDEVLKIYCNDCEQVICMMCYIKDHNGHKCSDITEVADAFREQMTHDVTGVVDSIDKCRQKLQTLIKEKEEFNEQVNKSEQEIREKTKQLKQMIDRHEEMLLVELRTVRQKRTKEMYTTYEEVERQVAAMESYMKYVNEIREKGTACDIARAASGLHDRAGELLKCDAIEQMLDDLGHANVTLTSSNFIPDDFARTVGELNMNVAFTGDLQRSPPRVAHVASGDTGVYAVTSLGDEVYTVRYNRQEVEVYDVKTFTLQRRHPVPQLSSETTGIAACGVKKCLYLSIYNNSSVIRVDLSTTAVKKWSVANSPVGLSVTSEHAVLVTSYSENKLQEYTTDGSLVREVCLQDVKSPWHAVKLSTGEYVVSQTTSRGVVSVAGVDGRVVRSYGQSPPSDVGPMKYPRSLAVTKRGDVLVADVENNRILAINSSFARAQELPLPADILLQRPFALCLDESRDRLYIGEWRDVQSRLIALDNVRRIRWN